jgi:hypothetical protein
MMPSRLESTDKAARAMAWQVVRFDGVLLAAAKMESVARRTARVLTGDVVGYARVQRRAYGGSEQRETAEETTSR